MDEKILISALDTVEYERSSNRYLFNNEKVTDEKNDNLEGDKNKLSEIVNNFVGKQFENLIVLTGAGSSILGDGKKLNGKDLKGISGQTVSGLRNEINEYLKEEITENENILDLNTLTRHIKYFENDEDFDLEKINIEDMLSKALIAKEFIDHDKSKFTETVNVIESKIRALCTIELDSNHPHGVFLEKITARRSSHNRVKIFTTNYDTLFEQAARKNNFILVDGFSYHYPRIFNPYLFDYDFIRRSNTKIIDEPDYVEKVIHLYKLHGSINWEKNDGEIIERERTDKPLMIYPRRDKFEQSYEAPYFEMFSRFQEELRKKNTLLISIGFSFGDKHVKTIVKNALKNNPSLNVLAVDYDIEQENFCFLRERAQTRKNIMLLGYTFPEFTDIYLKEKAYSNLFFERELNIDAGK